VSDARPSATDELVARFTSYDTSGLAVDAPPSLGIVILTCMDARIDPGDIFDLGIGEAHVIRSAGGFLTPEVTGAVALSQARGGTREIMIVHHTDCVAASALASGMAPRATALDTARKLRAAQAIPHRDAVRAFVLDLERGTLTEVQEGTNDEATAAATPARRASRWGPLGGPGA
jgi:carbonic anhydrase